MSLFLYILYRIYRATRKEKKTLVYSLPKYLRQILSKDARELCLQRVLENKICETQPSRSSFLSYSRKIIFDPGPFWYSEWRRTRKSHVLKNIQSSIWDDAVWLCPVSSVLQKKQRPGKPLLRVIVLQMSHTVCYQKDSVASFLSVKTLPPGRKKIKNVFPSKNPL